MNTMECLTESTLDLFQPHTIIEAIKYQSSAQSSDCWERRHIDAMCKLCEYVAYTYPLMYKQIQRTHESFMHKQSDC